MAGHRIFARGCLRHAAVRGSVGRACTARQGRHELFESHRRERRQTQRHSPRNVAERVASLVAVCCGIGQLTDANAIKNDEDDAGKDG
jgi:hypothetical protein